MCVLLPLSNFVGESGVEQRRGLMMESTPVGLRETCAVAMGKQINLLEFYSTTYQSPSSTLGLSQPPAESLLSALLDCEVYEAGSIFTDAFTLQCTAQ